MNPFYKNEFNASFRIDSQLLLQQPFFPFRNWKFMSISIYSQWLKHAILEKCPNRLSDLEIEIFWEWRYDIDIPSSLHLRGKNSKVIWFHRLCTLFGTFGLSDANDSVFHPGQTKWPSTVFISHFSVSVFICLSMWPCDEAATCPGWQIPAALSAGGRAGYGK